MITRDTVLVLGAGASMPFGFPSGQVLADLICWLLLTPDTPIPNMPPPLQKLLNVTFATLRQTFDKNKLAAFALHLAGEESVDAFLEHQPKDFVDIGKAAIAATLLPFEDTGGLDQAFMVNRLIGFFPGERKAEERRAGGNWYQLLWRAMNAPFEGFRDNLLKIVTFNYDRSLEHYLYSRLQRRYPDRNESEYATQMPDIAHIHGRLGYLPWQTVHEVQYVPYGAMWQNQHPLETAASRPGIERQWVDAARRDIAVVHETGGETDELKKARKWLRDCQRVYFLGFGYHEANLDRLRLKIESMPIVKNEILGTALGLSRERRDRAFNLIAGLHPRNYKRWTQGERDPRRILPACDVYTFLHDHMKLAET